MADPLPIRDGVVPKLDLEREMLDYCQGRIAAHVKRYGEAPDAIAIVTQSAKGRTAHSWSPVKGSDMLTTCATAAALLLHRSTEGVR